MVHVAILVVLIVIALVLAPWLFTIFLFLFGVVTNWLAENSLTIVVYLAAFVVAFSVIYFGGKKLLIVLLEKQKVRATSKRVELPSEPQRTGEHWSEKVKRLDASKDVERHKRDRKMQRLQEWAERREAKRGRK